MLEQSESSESVRRYYDALGEQEWERLTGTVRGRVSLELHRRFLRRFVRPGWRVLEVGAGPRRFTLELAALGCQIVVTGVTALSEVVGEEANDQAVRTGDLRHVVDDPGGTSARCSAGARSRRWWNARVVGCWTGAPATGRPGATQRRSLGSRPTPAAGARIVEHEAAAGAQPDARDGGTHILFAAAKVSARP